MARSAESTFIDAGRLIADPQRFCTGALARNRSGSPVLPTSPSAHQWDAAGAIMKILGAKITAKKDTPREIVHMLCELQLCATIVHRKALEAVADDLGHEAVLDVLRHAVRRARTMPEPDEQTR